MARWPSARPCLGSLSIWAGDAPKVSPGRESRARGTDGLEEVTDRVDHYLSLAILPELGLGRATVGGDLVLGAGQRQLQLRDLGTQGVAVLDQQVEPLGDGPDALRDQLHVVPQVADMGMPAVRIRVRKTTLRTVAAS